jgi:hypothetical protein
MSGNKKGVREKRIKCIVAKLTVDTVQHTKKALLPKPHIKRLCEPVTVSVPENCIIRKSAFLDIHVDRTNEDL